MHIAQAKVHTELVRECLRDRDHYGCRAQYAAFKVVGEPWKGQTSRTCPFHRERGIDLEQPWNPVLLMDPHACITI
jgi:hypothetical protein